MTALPPRRLATTMAVLAVLVTTLVVARPAHAQRPAAGANHTAYVSVAAATLWTEPDIARDVDAPATGNPVDLRAWTDNLTLDQRRWLVGNLETQALYGTKVTVLGRDGDWVHVAVSGQPTPRNQLGYPGWMPAAQLTRGTGFAALTAHRPMALVTAKTTDLYRDIGRRHRLLSLSMDTRLPVLARLGGAILVARPAGGVGWLSARDAHVYRSAAAIGRPTGADLARIARSFVGLPYVWAGTSAFGFDCSGFTHTIYDRYGITIPRDAGAQMDAGTPVAADHMRPGDLIFYAYDSGYIHHVGMYVGDGYEVDAPNNTATQISTVELVKVDAHRYADQYAGSRRYL